MKASKIAVAAVFLAGVALAQTGIPTVTGNARVDKLLSQMTLEEKIAMIHGGADSVFLPSTSLEKLQVVKRCPCEAEPERK